MRSYRITLRDRATQTVVGYYDGSWTTDRRRALDLRKREVAEAHAARMRELCPRNANLIKVPHQSRGIRRCRLALSAGGMGLVEGTRERTL